MAVAAIASSTSATMIYPSNTTFNSAHDELDLKASLKAHLGKKPILQTLRPKSKTGDCSQHTPEPIHIQATSATSIKSDSIAHVYTESQSIEDANKMSREVDFVIIGHGTAGKAALKRLCSLDPSASIAIIDPLSQPRHSDNVKLFHYTTSAVKVDHDDQIIYLQNGTSISYRSSVLLSTGSRGAPPPPSLIENESLDRVLELKSTSTIEPKLITIAENKPNIAPYDKKKSLPILPPQMVRNIALLAASQGANISILGSGIDALELTAAVSMAAKTSKLKKPLNSSSATLIFGNSSPLSVNIPQYLKNPIMKRLNQHGVNVHSRSLVRYISSVHESKNQNNGKDAPPRLEVHLTKSYDTLDTQRIRSDLLIVAPMVDTKCGTAVLPIKDNPLLGVNDFEPSSSTKTTYKAWSHLFSNNVVSCYSNDGRVVVNAELCAASGIYAAGSVARYPNDNTTGTAVVAGDGLSDATLAGDIAAQNMYRQYQKSFKFRNRKAKQKIKTTSVFSDKSIPIWRTDVCNYCENAPRTNALQSLGIHALFVGDCDTQRMSTHGFWWTNQASDIRKTHNRDFEKRNGGLLRRRSTYTYPSAAMKRAVYGIGIVFYLDRSGRICGVMTWGLPFANRENPSEPNQELLDRIKLLIQTNGEVACSAIDLENNSDFTIDHLAEESKHLMSIACSSGKITSKPLHRYVPSKPASSANLGSLKRNKANHGIEEHVFMKRVNSETSDLDISKQRPSSLIYVYPMDLNGGNPASNNPQNANIEKELNEQRSRPTREDPLWFYQEEQHKTYSVKEIMTEMFIHNLRKGKFADGSDPFESAPIPQSIQNVTNKAKQWSSHENVEEGKEEEHEHEHGDEKNA